MEKVIVEVSFSGKNYSAHIPLLPGCVTVGNSLVELRKNVEEVVPFHVDGMKEDNDEYSSVFDGEHEFVYKLSTEALINELSGIFTKAALSRLTGINERELWHYAAGVRRPRLVQRKRIVDGLHKLGNEFLSIDLY
jgi:predicted RNase H-like HicB family nuclease